MNAKAEPITETMQPSLNAEMILSSSQFNQAETDDLPLPPMRLKWLIHYFRLGFATFLLISTLLGFSEL
jgi:hypothetical protein